MADDEMKQAAKRAKESLNRGFGELFKAAGSAANAVKREAIKIGVQTKVPKTPSLGKAVEDASREVVRAASSVATVLGDSLAEWGRKAQDVVDPAHQGAPPDAAAAAPAGEDEWPKTREEYEKKYGRDGDDWPKSREEYEQKYGRPPRKRGDDDDPGFRIA